MRTVTMKTSVKVFDTFDDISLFFSKKIVNLISEKPTGLFFSLVLSGGSTPNRLFSFIAKNFREQIEWPRVKVFWGDERCVGPDHQESNFRMAKENMLDFIPLKANRIFRINGEADPFTEALRYDKLVRENVPAAAHVPCFDLIMLGLGEDGHTASVFPENMEILPGKRLYEATINPYTGQRRITATLEMINNARLPVFIVTGKHKAEMVARIIGKKAGWDKLPAAFVQPVCGELLWLLDTEAASGLKESEYSIVSKS